MFSGLCMYVWYVCLRAVLCYVSMYVCQHGMYVSMYVCMLCVYGMLCYVCVK